MEFDDDDGGDDPNSEEEKSAAPTATTAGAGGGGGGGGGGGVATESKVSVGWTDYIPQTLVAAKESAAKKKTLNPLLDHQVYVKVGGNSVLSAEPNVIHFSGYTPGSVHTQTISIINRSSVRQRLDILPPSTPPYFRLAVGTSSKKGLIAPGMAERVTVEFRPTEWRYYYDALKIHCADENLLVPIHAYPVMQQPTKPLTAAAGSAAPSAKGSAKGSTAGSAAVASTNRSRRTAAGGGGAGPVTGIQHIFPSRIDLGNCSVGESVTKIIRLESGIPLQFEYELTCVKPSGEFQVSPLKGIIPASLPPPTDGSAAPPSQPTLVTIRYTPTRPVTGFTQFLVTVSQFGAKPFVCDIFGSAVQRSDPNKLKSSVVDARTLERSRALAAAKLAEHAATTSTVFTRNANAGKSNASATASVAGGGGGGAGGFGTTQTGGSAIGTSAHSPQFRGGDGARPSGLIDDLHLNDPSHALGSGRSGGGSDDDVDDDASIDRDAVSLAASSAQSSFRDVNDPTNADAAEKRRNKRAKGGAAKSKSKSKSAAPLPAAAAEKKVVIGGVVIPKSIYTQAGVNFVLTQQAGKRKIKDMKRAIAASQAERAAQEATIRNTRTGKAAIDAPNNATGLSGTGTGAGGHPFDYSHAIDTDIGFGGESRQIREIIFERALADYAKHEKSVAINPTRQRIGHRVMPEHVRDALEASIDNERELTERNQRNDDRQRTRVQAVSYEQKRVVYMAPATSAAPIAGGLQPTWNVYEVDSWLARKHALTRFISSASKLVTRQRVERRIAAMRMRLAEHGLAAAAMRPATAQAAAAAGTGPIVPSLGTTAIAAAGGLSGGLTAITAGAAGTSIAGNLPRGFRLSAETVKSTPLVICADESSDSAGGGGGGGGSRQPIAIEPLPPFIDLPTFELRTPYEYKLSGYTELPTAVIPSYLPPERDRPLRTGALEEFSLLHHHLQQPATATAATAVGAIATGATAASGSSAGAGALGVSRAPSLTASPLDTEKAKSGSVPPLSPQPVATTAAAAAASAAAAAAGAAASAVPLPAYLGEPYPVAPFAVLRSEPTTSAVYSSLIGQSESDPAYCFRPTNIRQTGGASFHLKEIAGTEGGRSVVAIPTLAQVWRPRYQSVLAFHTTTSGLSVVPALQRGLDPADVHMDDDPVRRDVDRDEHHHRLHAAFIVPTAAAAKSLFDSDATAGTSAFVAPPLGAPDSSLTGINPSSAGASGEKLSARSGAANRKAILAAATTAASTGAATAASATAAATTTTAPPASPAVPPGSTATAAAAAARKRSGKEKEPEVVIAAPQPIRQIRHTVEPSDGAEQIERAINTQRAVLVHQLTQRIEHVNQHTQNFRLLVRPIIGLRDPNHSKPTATLTLSL